MQPLILTKIRGKGRGVLAGRRFKQDEVVEECPVLLFDVGIGESHLLECYAFRWNQKQIALALGWGSLYNHSETPNCVMIPYRREKTLILHALRDIDKGEELTFNYMGDSGEPVWFKVK